MEDRRNNRRLATVTGGCLLSFLLYSPYLVTVTFSPATGRRGCRSWPQAGCWAVSSPPAVPGCGKSPSVWACTTWQTWAAARRDDAAPKTGFQARLHFTLPETLARAGRFCRKLSMSGSCGGSLATYAPMPGSPTALELGFIHVTLHTVAAQAEGRRAACVCFNTASGSQ